MSFNKLTIFQEKNIKKKLSFDFLTELNKKTENKKTYSIVFSKQIEILVSKFDKQGILFYSIDIELPFLFKFQNKEIQKSEWEELHTHVEEFINYIGSNIELVEFCYLVIELKGIQPNVNVDVSNQTKKTFPCLKGLIGVRSLVGKNDNLIFELKDLFIISFFDVKINWLSSASETIKYWNLIIRQQNFRFHRFVNYSDFYQMIYGSIADEELKFDERFSFGQENHFISDTMAISGIKKKNPKKKEIIFYFLKLYLFHKNMFFYNNNIFMKDKKYKTVYKVFYTIDQMRDNFSDIYDSIKLLYPQQLSSFDITELILSDLDFVFRKIKKNNNLLSDKIGFNNIIEFRDGIFFIDKKLFIFFEKIPCSELEQLKTTYYIDFFYKDLNSSDFWLKILHQNLNQTSFDFFNTQFSLSLIK